MRSGGLGFRRTTDHLTSAFVASFARLASVEGLPCTHFPGFDSSFSYLLLTSKVPAFDAEILSQSRLFSIVDNTTYENLLVRLNQITRTRCLAVAQPHASAWLNVILNKASRTVFQSPQFCALIRMWLGISLTPSDYRCIRCYRHGDRYGLHALTCQFRSSRSYSCNRVTSRATHVHRKRRPVISSHKPRQRNLTSLTTETDLQKAINEAVAENKESFDFTESLKMTGTKMRKTDSEEEYCESLKVFDKGENDENADNIGIAHQIEMAKYHVYSNILKLNQPTSRQR
ncbi:hypothetical protein GJ496_002899 [Pomphorhynchus laevis]|nr:hypothetical protein GJ496_002899 [Pomphorhynchus laevis]